MWRKEDANPQASPEVSQPTGVKTGTSSTPPSVSSKAAACISQGIKIKGEVAGTEDLFVDGVVDGKISLANSSLTVGPNGTVKAEISAREIVLRGVAEGKFTAEERIQIWHSARVQGELKAERVSIEDGAELRGKVEAGKATAKSNAAEPTGRGKKTEHAKATELTGKDAGALPGAATAGSN
jgi:cytoskeletal protein CcmA (bactofilin family)